MDTTKLISSIQAEIEQHKENGFALLCLQNHVYGCFIIMEDIAQRILDVNDVYLVGNGFYLNMDSQFSQIGIRYYGFAMDGKAVFEGYAPEYKEAWLELFRDIHLLRDMEQVDGLEDKMIQQLQTVNPEHAYFMNALEHDGNLSPDWVEKALYVLHPSLKTEDALSLEQTKSALSSAKSDQPLSSLAHSKKSEKRVGRKLAHTRRQRHASSVKPSLSTTRRAAVRR